MSHRGSVIFVGSLPLDIREREIEDLFYKVGGLHVSSMVKVDDKFVSSAFNAFSLAVVWPDHIG
jgi:hypothetical protein